MISELVPTNIRHNIRYIFLNLKRNFILCRRVCRERSTLIAVGESLVREIARLRQDLETRTAMLEQQEMRAQQDDITKAYEVFFFY